jgi:hypothetical protein
MGRLTMFLQFITEHPDRTGAWLMFAYRCRFAAFEAVLEAELHGVGGLFDDKFSITQRISSYPIKKIVECQATLRKAELPMTDIEGLTNELHKTSRKPATIERMVDIYQGFAKLRYVDPLDKERENNDH